jgi:hypothetical protein
MHVKGSKRQRKLKESQSLKGKQAASQQDALDVLDEKLELEGVEG